MLEPIVKEGLLNYVWKTKAFVIDQLQTTEGIPIQIINYGTQNHDSGPDFFNSRIIIDDLEWSGNVEMHVYASDWNKHNHSADPAYNNVILHVVFEADEDIFDQNGRLLHCLEMKSLIPDKILQTYAGLIQSQSRIPCERTFPNNDTFPLRLALEGITINRLERKTNYYAELLEKSNGNWDHALYVGLSRYIGARVNMQPFEQLAQATPINILLKNKDQLSIIEAILFGQAGMLQASVNDDYFKNLKKEYAYQRKKYELRPIPLIAWKFARLRPANFPTLRIAQLARIIHSENFGFNFIKEYADISDVKKVLRVTASEYWITHFTFGKTSKHQEKKLGVSFIDLIIINVIVPLIFLYGIKINEQKYKDRAINLLLALKPEVNTVTKLFHSLGFNINNAMESQAILELKSSYCDTKNCLRCVMGNQIISK